MKLFGAYLLLVNVLGASLALRDKWQAKRGAWRVPERTLFALCALGGCPGVYLAMLLCGHKTRHMRFMCGIPAIFILQIVIVFGIYYYVYRGTGAI